MMQHGTHYYVISVAAERAGMHAQTLRQYDRLGLVTPARAHGGGRRYSERDVQRLREIQQLSQEEGINLAGIKRIMHLTQQVDELRGEVEELQRELQVARNTRKKGAQLVHVPRSQAVVVWSPSARRTSS